MNVIAKLVTWSNTRSPWAIVCLSALALLLAALYFQHVLGHAPCVKCIYQRSAVIGIFFASLLAWVYPHVVTRLIALTGWGGSAYWGLMQAKAHLEVIFPEGFFVPPCPFVPDFPSALPLHEWIPSVFAAPGFCSANDWQFIDMGMAQWMEIIFSLYLLGWAVAVALYLLSFTQYRKAAK